MSPLTTFALRVAAKSPDNLAEAFLRTLNASQIDYLRVNLPKPKYREAARIALVTRIMIDG